MPRLHRSSLAVLAAGLAASVLAACGSGPGTAAGGGPIVVATTTQVGDLARAVAGRRAGVRQILSANSDPHASAP